MREGVERTTTMKGTFAILIALVILAAATGAAQDTLWTRAYGGAANDLAYSVFQMDDGGFMICGGTESFGAGSWDVYILRTDGNGDTVWTRTYGGPDYDIVWELDRTADGHFILAGETSSFGAGDRDVYILKIDSQGDTVWTRTYGGTGFDRGTGVTVTSDGRYAVSGRTASFGAGDSDAYLVMVDTDGDTLGTRTYRGSQLDVAFSVVETQDSGFVLCGATASSGAGGYDYYLVKTDSQGDLEWTRTYGGPGADWGHAAIPTNDGGYIVVGAAMSFGHGQYDAYFVKTDSAGDSTWTRVYGDVYQDAGNVVREIPSEGYIAAGVSGNLDAGAGELYLWRLDVGGDTLWCHGYDRGGANNYQMAGDLRITADSCYIVVGEAETLGSGVNDAWILKIEEDCRAGVEKSPEEVTGQAICRLAQNHPNPFGERTLISFQLAQPGRVSLGVYNPAGQSVCTVIDGWLPPGDHVATWDATQFAPGARLLRLAVDGAESAVTAVVVK
jgi:hypothetical protein